MRMVCVCMCVQVRVYLCVHVCLCAYGCMHMLCGMCVGVFVVYGVYRMYACVYISARVCLHFISEETTRACSGVPVCSH